jgi:2-Cys peroxiredoxin 5
MKAWGKTLDPSGSSGVSVPPCVAPPPHQCTQLYLPDMQIRFLGDPSVAFTKALDLSFDGASIFGGDRSKRYALVIENGAVKEAHVESDNTGLNGTSWLIVR